jgi:flagellar hook-length control protein FliK
LPGATPGGGSVAASSGAIEALLARAAVTADGAAPSNVSATLELPARADEHALALALSARTTDTLPPGRSAGTAANLAAPLGLEASLQVPRAEPLGVMQLVPSAPGPAVAGLSPQTLAPGASAAPRSLAASPSGDAAARGLGTHVRAEAALASATSADVLLADAVRAAAAATDGEQAASLARWLGEAQALERAARSAGGALETAFASSGAASGAAPQPGTAATSGVGGAAAGANLAPQGNAAALDVRDAAWNEQLSGRIRWLVDRDAGEARIKLHPAELGSLDVKISMRDEQTFVHLAASSAAARDELEQSLPRLRELLAQNGLTLAGASVSGGRQEHSPRAYSAHARSVLETQDVTGVTEHDVAGPLHGMRGGDGRIDLYA